MEVHLQRTIAFSHDDAHLESHFTLHSRLPVARVPNVKNTMSAEVSQPHPSPMEKITVETITMDDCKEVIALLKAFFFKDEPLNKFLEMGECPDLEDYATKSIPDGCSFKALDTKGRIVGVALNGIIKRPPKDDEPSPSAAKCDHPKFKKVLALMDYIDSQFSMFDLYPDVNALLDCKILSVNENYRGLGIAGQLTHKTIEFMKANQIPMMHVLCSSHFSARVMEKLDFEEVYQLQYKDYVVNGENVLLPADPHKAVRILCKRIV